MKRVLIFSVSAAIVLCGITGCGDKNDGSKKETVTAEVTTVSETTAPDTTAAAEDGFPVGKWECSKMVTGDSVVTDILGFPVSVVMRFEFGSDGSAVCTNALSSEVTISGRWELSDDGFTVLNDGTDADTINFKRTADGIMFSESEGGVTSEIYFTQVDDFAQFDAEQYQNALNAASN